jgi:hypothetical protein
MSSLEIIIRRVLSVHHKFQEYNEQSQIANGTVSNPLWNLTRLSCKNTITDLIHLTIDYKLIILQTKNQIVQIVKMRMLQCRIVNNQKMIKVQ